MKTAISRSIITISTFLCLCISSFTVASSLDKDRATSQLNLQKLQQFQDTVNLQAMPLDVKVDQAIRIAIIYPSADISDFWVRNYTALTERLTELKIPFHIDEYSSKQIEHALQTQHTQTVLNAKSPYDFVIFGPSELARQAKNIQQLAASQEFKTFIWAFHTPDSSWSHQPDGWFDFSSAMGAEALCHYAIQHLGNEIEFAANRGIPGITDTQRSQGFIDCVEEKADWINVYEHFGQYQKLGGADGAKLFINNFPNLQMIHNANTAMTMGAVDALNAANKTQDIFTTGWGGTAKEIEIIKSGELDATPMRMSDDLGVATAESIKFHFQGRESELPKFYLGRILIAHKDMTDSELDAYTKEAFRYSGIPN
ncbi:substrate-binding domain-containing protein [Marinomonas sp. C2222]|uniref:Substrate-binding domain-containing protein n=1 Tax=Marinomonas sargassi TaxID=2984494 RepID=A0ABT2YPQ6_9GAMM|nr:substrate-binding domain-containing protein [Marinomonas sargassi]MCV2401868.1 substrate-binding domain-containing protein [Marinomonas sargassi]